MANCKKYSIKPKRKAIYISREFRISCITFVFPIPIPIRWMNLSSLCVFCIDFLLLSIFNKRNSNLNKIHLQTKVDYNQLDESVHNLCVWNRCTSDSLNCVPPLPTITAALGRLKPPILILLGSWNRLKHRNKFKNALRKPRFMKQYVIGLQQLLEYASNWKYVIFV